MTELEPSTCWCEGDESVSVVMSASDDQCVESTTLQIPPRLVSSLSQHRTPRLALRFSLAVSRWSRSTQCCSTLSPVSSAMGDCLRAGKLPHYITSHPGQLSLPSLRGRQISTSYSWEGKGRYGSFRLRMNVWVCR